MAPQKSCENICDYHREHELMIKQHEEILKEEKMEIKLMSKDIERIDTRGRVLMWFLSLTFLVICSISGYGIVQLNHFKEIYKNDIVKYTSIIEGLNKDIEIFKKYIPQRKFTFK
jgi:hypothetical protein